MQHQQQQHRGKNPNWNSCTTMSTTSSNNPPYERNIFYKLLSTPTAPMSSSSSKHISYTQDEILTVPMCSNCQLIHEQMKDELFNINGISKKSSVTGGSILHVLLQRCCYNHACPCSQTLIQIYLNQMASDPSTKMVNSPFVNCTSDDITSTQNSSMMLLLSRQDRFGNLPIHIAANLVDIAAYEGDNGNRLSIRVFQQLLHHTMRLVQQHHIRYMNSQTGTFPCRFIHQIDTLVPFDVVLPCILTRNHQGLTVCDYAVIQYIDHGSTNSSGYGISNRHRCYTNIIQSRDMHEYYKLLRLACCESEWHLRTTTGLCDVMSTMSNQNDNDYNQYTSSSIMRNKYNWSSATKSNLKGSTVILSKWIQQMIVPIISAGYHELQYLLRVHYLQQQLRDQVYDCGRCHVACWANNRMGQIYTDREHISNFAEADHCTKMGDSCNLFTDRTHDDPDHNDCRFILHYACALCGPIRIIHNIDVVLHNNYQEQNIHTLMHMDRSILELLLSYSNCIAASRALHQQRSFVSDNEGTSYYGLDIRHPITGQLPLHYAIQSNSTIEFSFRTRYRRSACQVPSLINTTGSNCESAHNVPSTIAASSSSERCKSRLKSHSNYEPTKNWITWIQTIVGIFPNACTVQDNNGYIPLHYALLLSSCPSIPTFSSTQQNNTDQNCFVVTPPALTLSLPLTSPFSNTLFTIQYHSNIGNSGNSDIEYNDCCCRNENQGNNHGSGHQNDRDTSAFQKHQHYSQISGRYRPQEEHRQYSPHDNNRHRFPCRRNKHAEYNTLIHLLLTASPSSVDIPCPVQYSYSNCGNNLCQYRRDCSQCFNHYGEKVVYLDVYQLVAITLCRDEGTSTGTDWDSLERHNHLSRSTQGTDNTSSATTINGNAYTSLDILYTIIRLSPSRISSALL